MFWVLDTSSLLIVKPAASVSEAKLYYSLWISPVPPYDFMRWAIALRRRSFSAAATTTVDDLTGDITRDLSAADDLLYVLDTSSSAVTSLLRPLSLLAPRLTSHSAADVLRHHSAAEDPSAAFRLFIAIAGFRHLRSWSSHNLIISTLLKSTTNFDFYWAALVAIHSAGQVIAPAAFSPLISAYSAARMPEKALEAFSRMPEFGSRPNTFTYNTLLQVLVKNHILILAMAVYSQMLKLDCRPNRATYTIVLHGLCCSSKTNDALKLFDEMLQKGILPSSVTYTVFLSYLCRSGRLDDAKRLFSSMKTNNYRIDTVVYNTMLNGFCKAGKTTEALEHLELFEKEGFVLGLTGYSCLIEGFFKSGKFDQACEMYNEMIDRGLIPDCVIYTNMIKRYSEAGRIEEAFVFLSEMTKRGLVPDTFCYNTLIKGLCDAGLLDEAKSLLLEVSKDEAFPDSVTHTIMICGLCKEGLVDEAQKIFDEMRRIGCEPTIITFNSLIDGLCKAGKMEEAKILFYRMHIGKKPSLFLRLSQGADRVRDTNSLHKLVDELCQKGMLLKAYKLLNDIVESGVVPDIVTYNILINGLCKAGNVDDALKLFKDLMRTGHSPDEITYNTLMDGLLRVQREDESSVVLQYMLRSGLTPSLSIYATLMKAKCKMMKVSQAINLWLEHLQRVRKLPQDKATIKEVQKKFELGELQDAIRALIELDCRHDGPDPFPYTIWLIGFCQAQKYDEALKIFALLREFNIEVTVPSCAVLISNLCQNGNLDSAIDVMLYALGKGLFFMQPVGNILLKQLCLHKRKKDARRLAQTMRSSGYDMNEYLLGSTKELLHRR